MSRCRCGRGEPSPGADVAGVSPVPAQLSRCRCGQGRRPLSRCRCGRGEPSQPRRSCGSSTLHRVGGERFGGEIGAGGDGRALRGGHRRRHHGRAGAFVLHQRPGMRTVRADIVMQTWRGEPSPRADALGVGPVTSQIWAARGGPGAGVAGQSAARAAAVAASVARTGVTMNFAKSATSAECRASCAQSRANYAPECGMR